MELTSEDDVSLFQWPYLHAGSIDQGQGIFEHVIPADGQVYVHQLLQDLGGGTERSEIQQGVVEEAAGAELEWMRFSNSFKVKSLGWT